MRFNLLFIVSFCYPCIFDLLHQDPSAHKFKRREKVSVFLRIILEKHQYKSVEIQISSNGLNLSELIKDLHSPAKC